MAIPLEQEAEAIEGRRMPLTRKHLSKSIISSATLGGLAAVLLSTAFAASDAKADPARVLGYVAGHHNHFALVGRTSRGPMLLKRRDLALVLKRGKNIGLRRQ